MPGTKERIMETTAGLFRRYGYTGTGMKQIVAEANAPFGSLYHHFPGGKEELGTEVILSSGAMYGALFEAIMDAAPDVPTGVSHFFAGAAETLRQTGYEDACPIETVALEVASSNETLRKATAEVFESWTSAATSRFTAAGIPEARSRELALSMLAGLEGAFVLSRATRDTQSLDAAGAAATEAVRAALP
ncbi:MAG: TetR/AcrR family transcriptional regulator [Solirubrobacterales bacterium]|nr:TetR/AcrR family transcriptional regulator [Solirubrobacterales bacterium]